MAVVVCGGGISLYHTHVYVISGFRSKGRGWHGKTSKLSHCWSGGFESHSTWPLHLWVGGADIYRMTTSISTHLKHAKGSCDNQTAYATWLCLILFSVYGYYASCGFEGPILCQIHPFMFFTCVHDLSRNPVAAPSFSKRHSHRLSPCWCHFTQRLLLCPH